MSTEYFPTNGPVFLKDLKAKCPEIKIEIKDRDPKHKISGNIIYPDKNGICFSGIYDLPNDDFILESLKSYSNNSAIPICNHIYDKLGINWTDEHEISQFKEYYSEVFEQRKALDNQPEFNEEDWIKREKAFHESEDRLNEELSILENGGSVVDVISLYQKRMANNRVKSKVKAEEFDEFYDPTKPIF